MNGSPEISTGQVMSDAIQRMKARGDAFAVATVVRTVSVTAAKPGAKAILDANGVIVDGWIGGGCARHAVMKAAQQSIADGEPRLISLQPEELLEEQGITSGQQQDGRLIASNMCPSRGSMDIFVEPVLSNPELLVIGASPVAVTLVQLAPMFDFTVSVMDKHFDELNTPEVSKRYNEYSDVPKQHTHRYIVVATQGSGDVDALAASIALDARHLAFVGSQRKIQFLRGKLAEHGQSAACIERIAGPAGLDIGGVTPQEIALSILAELIQVRRST